MDAAATAVSEPPFKHAMLSKPPAPRARTRVAYQRDVVGGGVDLDRDDEAAAVADAEA